MKRATPQPVDDEATTPFIPRNDSMTNLDAQPRGPIRWGALNQSQTALEERLRTVCLAICAGGVVSWGLAKLKFALVPLVLSLALRYLLQPMIDALTRTAARRRWRRDEPSKLDEALAKRCGKLGKACVLMKRKCTRLALPYSMAVLVSLALALGLLIFVAMLIAESVRDFTGRADAYAEQVQNALVIIVRWMDAYGISHKWRRTSSLTHLAEKLQLSAWVTATVFSIGEGLLSLLSTTFLVILFTLYLLLTPSLTNEEEEEGDDTPKASVFQRKVDRQIHTYVKGKVALSALVAILTAGLLYALRVDLWLAFSVVAFFANFVPNLGAIVAVALPMPVVLIDPDGSPFHSGMAFFSLVLMHALVGNVVEPVFFGHSMRLHPVVGLLSLMIWGFIWGVPGCVLAVPITAVLRIYLQSIDHPLALALANVLDGFARPVSAFLPPPSERPSTAYAAV